MPLSHIRVIDLCRARAGRTCVRQLSEFGAQVIKVEIPGQDEDEIGLRRDSDFQNLHRTPGSPRSAAPDLGRHTDEIWRELEHSDAEIAPYAIRPTLDCRRRGRRRR